jgi:hypothetical protein
MHPIVGGAKRQGAVVSPKRNRFRFRGSDTKSSRLIPPTLKLRRQQERLLYWREKYSGRYEPADARRPWELIPVELFRVCGLWSIPSPAVL